MDILGRPIRKATRSFKGTWVYQDFRYDNIGRLQRQSLPYFAGSGGSGFTTFHYDILGRLTETTLPDQGVTPPTTNYAGFTATNTNSLGQTKTETRNALGELVSVEDNLGGKVYYGYDARGNLAQTRHDNGTVGTGDDSVIALEYDILGRKTAMDDPDKGVWQYKYTAFGELKEQTNAKGQTTEFEYDGLGRKTISIDSLASGQVEGGSQWFYESDDENNSAPLNLLVKVEDVISGYKKLMRYDNLGRLSKTETALGVNGSLGTHYEKVTYDQYGRAFQTFDAARNGDTYTNNGVEYLYNEHGFQHQIVDAVRTNSNGPSRQVYHTITDVDARGNITQETLGGSVVTRTTSYDALTGRLDLIQAANSNKVIQSLDHHWDDIGNLDYVVDTGTGSHSSGRSRLTDYGYDGLNRLTSTLWKRNGITERTDNTSYYLNGNIKTKTGVGTYLYDELCGCGPHAVTKAGNTTFQYDANGNMVRDSSGRKIAYTTFDKPYYIEKGATKVTFNYNPGRSRYVRTDSDGDGTKTTLYLGSVEKITNKDGSKEWKRYIGGNLMIVQKVNSSGNITSSDDRYFLKDHLGSPQFILDSAGMVVQAMSFDPWGARLANYQSEGVKPWAADLYNVLETTRGFTGHEMVDGLDIVHMNGRIYDSRLGRFLQADSVIDGVADTQGYNRYSYVQNNPLNATDPSGHSWTGFRDSILKPFVQAVVTFYCVPCGAALAAATTLHYGGGFGDAVIAAFSTYALATVGAEIGGSGGVGFGFNIETLGFASLGGITSTLQGGKFGHGFVSAGVGSVAGAKFGPVFSKGGFVGVTLGSAIVGGTLSKLTGGKFANGAATAAFTAILSSAANREKSGGGCGDWTQACVGDDGLAYSPGDGSFTDSNGNPMYAVNYVDLALDVASFGFGVAEGGLGLVLMTNPATFTPGLMLVGHSSLGLANTVLSINGNLSGVQAPGVLEATGDALFGNEGRTTGYVLDRASNLSGAVKGVAKFGADTISTVQEMRNYREQNYRER